MSADFGADEELVCPCGHRVRQHDAWGCVDCDCHYFPSRAIDAAKAVGEDRE